MLPALTTFALGLVILLVAAHFFTAAAERIGLALGMSAFVVGVFIISIGTSLPELVASLLSVRAGTSEIVAGNVLGANAANLLLILGAVSIAVPGGRIDLGEQYLSIDLHFLLGSILLLGTVMFDGIITRAEGWFLLAAYAVYVAYLLTEGRTDTADAQQASQLPDRSRRLAVDVAILVVCAAAIFVGGSRTVTGLEALAGTLNMSPAIASVTILAIGTTFPELVICTLAARRGRASLAFGNILGSCIFNALAVSGAAAAMGGVLVPMSLRSFALPFVAAATLLFYLLTQEKRTSRWQGMLFLLLFLLFMGKMTGIEGGTP